jgi:hypothetical protein
LYTVAQKPRPSAQFRSDAHRAPLSAFLFSRQADSLTRFRYSRVIACLLRPSSNSPEALWEHDEALPCPTRKNLFGKAQRLVRQSLETAVFSVAKQRLPDKSANTGHATNP